MAGELVGRNKNAPKRRMNTKHLAEREAISSPREVSEDLGQRQQSTETVMQTLHWRKMDVC